MVVDLADLRDLIVVISGITGIVVLAVILAVTILLFTKLSAILGNVKKTTQTVRATTTLISDTAVKPIIRGAGVFAGVRTAISVIVRLRGRKGGK